MLASLLGVTTSTVPSNIPFLYFLFCVEHSNKYLCISENRENIFQNSLAFWVSWGAYYVWHRNTEVRSSAVESATLPFTKAVFSCYSCCLPQLVVFGKVGLKWLKHFGMKAERLFLPILSENSYNYFSLVSLKTAVRWSRILEFCRKRNSVQFFSNRKLCDLKKCFVCIDPWPSCLNSESGSPHCAVGDVP